MDGLRMTVGVVLAGTIGAGVSAGDDPVARAGALGISYFGGLTPQTEEWFGLTDADLDGDGHVDMVGISADGRRLGVVASRPGGYRPLVTLDLCECFGSGIPPVATGDVDGDGFPEVLVADRGGRRVWAVPFAGGEFGAGWWIDAAGQSFNSFAFDVMADLDGDGKDDLLFVRSGEVVVVPSGSPGSAFVRAVASTAFDALVDLTGDGVADAVHAVSGLVRVYPGGPEGFGAAVEIAVSPGVVSVVDLDGDGAADLIGSDDAAGEGWIRRNEGGGLFGEERRFAAEASFSSLVGVGDLDGSGLPDVVGLIKPPGFHSFARHIWQDPWTGAGLDSVGLVPHVTRFSSRDLDGDGSLDLVALRIDEIVGLLNRGGAPVVGTRTNPLGVDPLDVRAADFDGDGTPQLVVCDFDGLSLWRRQADGSYIGETLASGGGSRFMSVPFDLDGDGHLDLVVTHSSGAIEVWPGGPDGLGTAPVRYEFDEPARFWQTAIGDVTGNGVPDVVVADRGAGAVRVLIGVPGGFPVAAESVAMELAKTVAIMDLDGDGVMEIVASGEPEYTIRGFKRVADDWDTVAEIVLDARPYWLAADDLDGDGWTDLAVGFDYPPFRSVQVLYGGPAGLAAPVDVGLPQRGHAEVAIADVNGDGLLDLVIAPWGTLGVRSMATVMLQTEPREFVEGGPVPGIGASGVTVADVDGDGVLDIVGVCNHGSTDLIQVYAGRDLSCPADITGDGELNFFDLSAYLALFNQQDPAADLAEPFGEFNFFDLAAYLNLFNAGCP